MPRVKSKLQQIRTLHLPCEFRLLGSPRFHDVSNHADGSRVSIALICYVIMSVCLSVCVCVCPQDKIKTAKTKIAKLGTVIVQHVTSPTNEY